ncbi:hypothetical protein [Marinobacter zhejiangensis]|uniref:hypothetical protein n=1 Tax=Marinobacter zhejiangensis TaxID=488535 RepID=UPI000B817D11|nr:hypothetical protein [Marinobacter zhejiangensis]
MKKMITAGALSLTVLLGSVLSTAPAADDLRESSRKGTLGDMGPIAAEPEQYGLDEIRIMAYAQALRRFGPGIDVTVEETPDGTYLMKVLDADQSLMQEHEFELYGMPARNRERD